VRGADTRPFLFVGFTVAQGSEFVTVVALRRLEEVVAERIGLPSARAMVTIVKVSAIGKSGPAALQRNLEWSWRPTPA
jgi:hypothetical protein